MKKIRLDNALVIHKLVSTRSQAESYIKLGQVKVNGVVTTKAGFFVSPTDKLSFDQKVQYVSRAALKLASVAQVLDLDFSKKTVLDVGSSTGGFTDFALRNGAHKVISVDVGSNQMHPSLRDDPRIELHEKTDIRSFAKPKAAVDIALIDVSFISLRDVLPDVSKMVREGGEILAMVKPQFEAGPRDVNKGVIKNDKIRRKILHDFESWSKKEFVIGAKADSAVTGAKGNRERFYLLRRT